MTLLDPSYAKKYIPIIASVSEHQPTTWTNYFFDMGYLLFFVPAGYYFCLIHDVTIGKIFIGLYGVLATYFSCVMIRLMLTLAPVVCVIAAIAISEVLTKVGDSIRASFLEENTDNELDAINGEQSQDQNVLEAESKKSKRKSGKASPSTSIQVEQKGTKKRFLPVDASFAILIFIVYLLSQ